MKDVSETNQSITEIRTRNLTKTKKESRDYSGGDILPYTSYGLYVRKRSWPITRYYPRIPFERQRKIACCGSPSFGETTLYCADRNRDISL